MITISGTLLDSMNARLKYCEVFLQAIDNSGESLNSSNKSFRTNEQGFYSEQIPYGRYRVFLRNRDHRQYYVVKDEIVVDNTTPNQTLNELID